MMVNGPALIALIEEAFGGPARELRQLRMRQRRRRRKNREVERP
jgi:hypothetical protein